MPAAHHNAQALPSRYDSPEKREVFVGQGTDFSSMAPCLSIKRERHACDSVLHTQKPLKASDWKHSHKVAENQGHPRHHSSFGLRCLEQQLGKGGKLLVKDKSKHELTSSQADRISRGHEAAKLPAQNIPEL